MKKILLLLLFILSINSYGQFSKELIDTDSSHIEIIRNSIYRCYEETYKFKDSIWWSVSFIDDTNQINTEGWKTKSGRHLGIWKEFNRKGKLKYVLNYDTGISEINRKMYPHYNILEKMKTKADSLIIAAYSPEFFDKHVRFEFNFNAYNDYHYLGSWKEPLTGKPNRFLIRYSIIIGDTGWYPEMIAIELDSLGNYIPNSSRWDNFGFENVKGDKKTFHIDKDLMIEIAENNGLILSDSASIEGFLTWEKFNKKEFFNGQFRYYIIEYTGKKEYQEGIDRKGVIYKYNVYTFNPWTGEFVEKKKMKTISEYGRLSGHSTGLLPDNE